MPDDEPLLETLALVRERGPIGERSLTAAVAHADRFVALIPTSAQSMVDLGAGGGLPGLVVAWRRRAMRVTLVERRGSRADLLERAVHRLGLGETVRVWPGDVAGFVATGASVDVVTARSFASPALTARWGAALLVGGGLLLVSEPPMPEADAPRWPPALLDRIGLVDEGAEQGIRRLRRA
jgi:16S rRNA G527 N7-methylase RsmG